jgi:hypothetical protein
MIDIIDAPGIGGIVYLIIIAIFFFGYLFAWKWIMKGEKVKKENEL